MNSLTFNPRLLLLVMLLTMVIQGWRTNTHIMNGILQDFDTAIYRASSSPSMKDVEEVPMHDAQTHTYRFPQTNIVVENVTFKNNGKTLSLR